MTREQPVAPGDDLSAQPAFCPFLFRAGRCRFHDLISYFKPASPIRSTHYSPTPNRPPFSRCHPKEHKPGQGDCPQTFPVPPPPVRALTLAHAACHALELRMESGSYPGFISGSPPHSTGLSGLGSILLTLVDLDLWPFLGATMMGLWPGSLSLAHQAPQDGGKVAISPSSASTRSGRGDSPASQPWMYGPPLQSKWI